MKEINILSLLTVKAELSCLSDNLNAHQAIEKIMAHGYQAIPVISKHGEYLGSITEGDLLRTLGDEDYDIEALEDINIKDVIRKDYMPPVKVDASMNELIAIITEQNYAPIVDDRNILMGIITRKRVIKALTEK